MGRWRELSGSRRGITGMIYDVAGDRSSVTGPFFGSRIRGRSLPPLLPPLLSHLIRGSQTVRLLTGSWYIHIGEDPPTAVTLPPPHGHVLSTNGALVFSGRRVGVAPGSSFVGEITHDP